MLLGLMRTIQEAGVCCPEEISVIGFDDYIWTANYSPKLTTLAQPASEIGRAAMEMLLAKIAGSSPGAESKLLKGELRARESTCPCKRALSVTS
jgi:DNA-binding LacI/PurR family transcriptional regulator